MDYDAPRHSVAELDEDSLEEFKARRASARSPTVDLDEADAVEDFVLPGADPSGRLDDLLVSTRRARVLSRATVAETRLPPAVPGWPGSCGARSRTAPGVARSWLFMTGFQHLRHIGGSFSKDGHWTVNRKATSSCIAARTSPSAESTTCRTVWASTSIFTRSASRGRCAGGGRRTRGGRRSIAWAGWCISLPSVGMS
jgi:hypothetical protein